MTQRIAYVSTVHPLHDHRFLYKQCRGLAEKGFRVCYYVRAEKAEDLFGVRIIPLSPPRPLWKRALYSFRLLPPLLRGNYDAIHLVDLELLPLGIILKLLGRSRVIFDAHEDYTSFMAHKYYMPASLAHFFKYLVQFLLAFCSQFFDGYIFADEGTATRLRLLPRFRRCYFYNYPYFALFPTENKPWPQRQTDIVYLGSMSRTGGMLVMLEAIRLVCQARPGTRAVFIGEPGKDIQEKVKTFLVENRLTENVRITGRIPHHEVPALLQDCKVGLVGLLNLPKFQNNIATKMFEYMISGVPVVSVDLPPERKFIEPGQQGLLVPPENPAAMAAAIQAILADEATGERMSVTGRETIRQRGWYAEKMIEDLEVFYRRILGEKRL